MPRKIIVHLGLHKTATTSLQKFLQANTGKFLQRGVRYIPLQRVRNEITPLFCSLDKSRRQKLTNFLQEIDKETVLFSDENLIGAPIDIIRGEFYSFARNRVEAFCEDMKDARITLFLTLRDPHLFLSSMYSEYLRHKDFIRFDQFLCGFDVLGFSYWKTFGWLRNLPSNTSVHVIPFEAAAGGGVVRIAREIIVEACGSDSDINPAAFPAQKSRSAYSAEELDLAEEIARRADPATVKFFLKALDGHDKRFGTTRFLPLPASVSEKLSECYQSDLLEFAKASPSHSPGRS